MKKEYAVRGIQDHITHETKTTLEISIVLRERWISLRRIIQVLIVDGHGDVMRPMLRSLIHVVHQWNFVVIQR